MKRLTESDNSVLQPKDWEQIKQWVQKLCSQMVRQGWDSRRYNKGEPWNAYAIDDLAQETLERLVQNNEARIKAILDSAEDDQQKRKHLRYEIRNALQYREENQPFSNLIKRIRKLAKEGHFDITRIKGVGDVVSKPDSDATYRALTSAEIRSCASRCDNLPIIYSTRHSKVTIDPDGEQKRQQTSPMYSTEHLIVAVNRILETSGTVTTFELREIFEFLLTPWSRNMDVPFEETITENDNDYDFGSHDPDDSNSPHDRAMRRPATNHQLDLPNTTALVNKLTEHESFLLLCLGSGITFVAISDHNGVTRQTIATHSREAQSKLQAALLADQLLGTFDVADVRQLLIDHLALHFAEDLTVDERKLWVYAAQQAQAAIHELAIENALDLTNVEPRLKAMFVDRIVFALRHDSLKRSQYEQVDALRATKNACAERIPQ